MPSVAKFLNYLRNEVKTNEMLPKCVLFTVFRKHNFTVALRLLSQCAPKNIQTFKFTELEIIHAKPSQLNPKPDPNSLIFGRHFSDHMLEVEWSLSGGWGIPRICPLHNLSLHPSAKVFHYAQELFEGMKAYRCVDSKVRLFRPDLNIKRMLATAERADLPLFDGEEFLKCLKKLISIDHEWVPSHNQSTLYIRPTMIGIEPALGVSTANRALLYVITGPVGPYFSTGVKPVSLLADPKFIRACPGGIGDKKMGANYAPTIAIQKYAEKMNLQQVLWLYGEDHQLTEVGTMNIFAFIVNKDGEKELITPPLSGIILPGVTRKSLLDLAREWKEFKVTERVIKMKEVIQLLQENRLLEIFGAGTACVVCPVSHIHYLGQELHIPTMEHVDPLNMKFMKALTDIQFGKVKHEWSVNID